MPIYEYRCDGCWLVFSYFFRSVRAAETGAPPQCPECGSVEVQRLISAAAVLSNDPVAEARARESAQPAPSPLYGRKEIQEQMRQERNRRSIARVDGE
ncbi:MAG: hypothetical protein JXB47_09045 [Anaerolineae bacterium]|nr:hypothetical protein [Anaerolineae bacterium]